MRAFLFIFCLPLISYAENLPTVRPSDLRVGNSFTWDFIDLQTKNIYSTETYTIIGAEGTKRWIEMSSRIGDKTQFTPTHRLHVDLSDCLNAYADKNKILPWTFEMFFLDGKDWRQIDPPSTLAFEEKFNCDPHPRDDSNKKTNFDVDQTNWRGKELFQQTKLGTTDSPWYFFKGDLAGIMAKKYMIYGQNSPGFLVRLRDSKARF